MGLGVDFRRWSLDFAYHRTIQNNNHWRTDSTPHIVNGEPFVAQSKTGGEDMIVRRMTLTVGYRLP